MSEIKQGMEVQLTKLEESKLKLSLRRLGLVEGMTVQCRMARKNIVALQWPGTIVAVRRKDLSDMNGRVIVWIH